MLPGYEHVGQAVDDPSWHADLGKVEAPWLEEAKVIVNPTPDAIPKCLARGLPDDVVTLFPSKLRTIRVRKVPVVADYLGRVGRNAFECFGRLSFEFGRKHGFALDCPSKLLDVVRSIPSRKSKSSVS